MGTSVIQIIIKYKNNICEKTTEKVRMERNVENIQHPEPLAVVALESDLLSTLIFLYISFMVVFSIKIKTNNVEHILEKGKVTHAYLISIKVFCRNIAKISKKSENVCNLLQM